MDGFFSEDIFNNNEDGRKANQQMKNVLKWAVAICFFAAAGCAYQGKTCLPKPGLPEEINIASPGKLVSGRWRVCVFEFSEPRSAPGMGRVAADSLRYELLRNKVFSTVALHPKPGVGDPDALLEFARSKKFDLIITGDLLYWLDGGFSIPSRVDEQIQIVMARTKKADVLWDALATETAEPVSTGDMIFAQRRPARAVSAQTLLKTNAEKFCNMILSRQPKHGKSSKVMKGE